MLGAWALRYVLQALAWPAMVRLSTAWPPMLYVVLEAADTVSMPRFFCSIARLLFRFRLPIC